MLVLLLFVMICCFQLTSSQHTGAIIFAFDQFGADLSLPCQLQCMHDVLGSLWVQQVGFLSHWDPYAVISLEAVAYS